MSLFTGIAGERISLADRGRGFEFSRSLAAYAHARDLAKDAVALDLGCGEGYGSNLLAKTAQTVTGLDASQKAVERARASHSRENLSWLTAPAQATGLPGAYFDLICAFQMIEHFQDPVPVLREMARLLKPDGSILISTLNRAVSGSVFNPYHAREYDLEEFRALLAPHLRIEKLLGVHVGSDVLAAMNRFKSRAALLLKLDVFGLRKLPAMRGLYDLAVTLTRRTCATSGARYDNSFQVCEERAETAVDFIAVCRKR
jgi:SAM-dependent methyltransferase